MSMPNHQPDSEAATVAHAGPSIDAADADIILRSSDGANFRTYKFILSFVSPVFRTMLSLPQPPGEAAPSSPLPSLTPPIITLQEDGHTLNKLLTPCYPGYGVSLDSLDDLRAVLRAADKYDIQSVLDSVREWMVISPLLQINPLHFYMISCAQGWEAVARLSATKVIETVDFCRLEGAQRYIPEMEDASAGAYHRLLEYRTRCGAAAQRVLEYYNWYDEKTFRQLSECDGLISQYWGGAVPAALCIHGDEVQILRHGSDGSRLM
ncbi:hypothetical protein BJ138DRAFT_1144800 [Hygrophoropsis aurantiaca]|uniref:Uncharacterized protein n=1 Tax=Hygrophoropsis aurantiaca TaxID=72124 RepID=A0ACB8AL58_9AGAM|nr:hypothetical protein BJ138DRAFT_1144800 [Hygrophoropsis aurantiaca]